MTETKKHKGNLIILPKIFKKLNRYNDILPCKKTNFYDNLDKNNTVFLKNPNLEEEIIDNYINASYIDVKFEFY